MSKTTVPIKHDKGSLEYIETWVPEHVRKHWEESGISKTDTALIALAQYCEIKAKNEERRKLSYNEANEQTSHINRTESK